MTLKDMQVLVVSDGYWGKGDTIPEATKNLRKAGGKAKPCIVYVCHPDAFVDGMGYLCSPDVDSAAKEIDRRGFKKV